MKNDFKAKAIMYIDGKTIFDCIDFSKIDGVYYIQGIKYEDGCTQIKPNRFLINNANYAAIELIDNTITEL